MNSGPVFVIGSLTFPPFSCSNDTGVVDEYVQSALPGVSFVHGRAQLLAIANIAFDAVVNRVLVAAGFTLPEGAVWLPQYDDLSEEEIFWILKKAPDVGGQPGGKDEGGETLGWGPSDPEENEEGDEEGEEEEERRAI